RDAASHAIPSVDASPCVDVARARAQRPAQRPPVFEPRLPVKPQVPGLLVVRERELAGSPSADDEDGRERGAPARFLSAAQGLLDRPLAPGGMTERLAQRAPRVR